jgi:pimeloyl-ACP methyl ester carboxylesterase
MDGRVLVMLHGQPGSGSDWLGVASRLPKSFECLVVDRPGYATNPASAGGFRHNAGALLAEMDDRGIDRAVLVGHSWGAGVALATAKLAPGRVEAVVLVAGVGPDCVTLWDRVLAAPLIGPVCAVVAWSLTPWIARARLARVERLRDRRLSPDEHVNWHVWGQARHDQGPPVWRSFLVEQRALLSELDDLMDSLATLLASMPVLLLHDPADAIVPLRSAARLAAMLPGAELVLVSGGHQLPRRSPGPVAAAIAAFVDRLPSGDHSHDVDG